MGAADDTYTSVGAWGQIGILLIPRNLDLGFRVNWLNPSTDLANDRFISGEVQLAYYVSHSPNLVVKLRYGFGNQQTPGMDALGPGRALHPRPATCTSARPSSTWPSDLHAAPRAMEGLAGAVCLALPAVALAQDEGGQPEAPAAEPARGGAQHHRRRVHPGGRLRPHQDRDWQPQHQRLRPGPLSQPVAGRPDLHRPPRSRAHHPHPERPQLAPHLHLAVGLPLALRAALHGQCLVAAHHPADPGVRQPPLQGRGGRWR